MGDKIDTLLGDGLLDKVSYAFWCDSSDALWRIHRLSLAERLSAPYDASVELATHDTHTEVDALLGAPCDVSIARGPEGRDLFGIVSVVEYVGMTEDVLVVRATIVPALALLAHTTNSRIFEEMSANDIIAAVLEETLAAYGRTFEWRTHTRGSSQREYCVQHRETDLEFVHRLLEEEGIAYHFVQDAGRNHEVIVFTDANGAFQELETADGSSRLTIVEAIEGNASAESLRGFDFVHALASTDVARRDFNWRTPATPQTAEQTTGGDGPTRRVYVHGDERYCDGAAETRSGDTMATIRQETRIGRAASNAISFSPGWTFELDHPSAHNLSGKYLLTSVLHRGYAPEELLSTVKVPAGSDEERYSNLLECIPIEMLYRPPARTPRPRIYGPQTAIVVGEGDEEIFTDEHGRIKVRFHWDEGGALREQMSCWLRVAQSFAGPGWGAQFIPRVGMEVVVEFLEGNPDRPLVTGCVYNGDNRPPFSLPEDKTQTGWRTDTSSGGGGSNELRFEDSAGHEQIYMHGKTDSLTEIEHDTARSTGNDDSTHVGRDQSEAVGQDQTQSIGRNRTEHVGTNHTETIGSNRSLNVGSNATETVGSAKSVSVAATYDVNVGKAMSVAVGSTRLVTVGGAATEAVGGSKSVTVAKDSTTSSGRNTSVDAGSEFLLKSQKKMTLSTQDNFIVTGDKKATITIKDELVLKCGKAQIIMKKNGDIMIKGKVINLKASGNIVAKGKKILHN
ncbi:MAG: type VI secretion system tip protein TssI/VgrG [Nannocystaceae bacterium]